MEDEKFKKGELLKKLLRIAGTGLILGAAVTMPGILLAVKPFLQNKKTSYQALSRAYRMLVRKKFVRVMKNGDVFKLEITEEGKRRYKEYQLHHAIKDLKISEPKTWDRKWHLLIFDIPEKRRAARDALRNFLGHLGCYQFQKSAFLHPFNFENEIDLLADMFHIQKYVTCFTIDSERVPHEVAFHFAKLLSGYIT
ncbi:MAG: hypothetical protein HYS52_02060 [Candidatus Wildermuthbacteria bacterium]|nr:hypothetical protein [Candidatus Wildermuthbacteria bacterium]